jgi:hypothetical protein
VSLDPEFLVALEGLRAVLDATPEADHPRASRAWLRALRDIRGHGLRTSEEFAAVLDL